VTARPDFPHETLREKKASIEGDRIDIGRLALSLPAIPFGGVAPLVKRLKRAARWKRALRRSGIYLVSLLLLAILLSPLWIAWLVWGE